MNAQEALEDEVAAALQRVDDATAISLIQFLTHAKGQHLAPRLLQWVVDELHAEGQRRAAGTAGKPKALGLDRWSDKEIADAIVFGLSLHRCTITGKMDELAERLIEAVGGEAASRLETRHIARSN